MITNRRILKYTLGTLPLLFFVGLSVYLFAYTSPEQIVEFVGVKNAYGLIFIAAIFGGFTTFNVIPYHLLLITLSLGGLNPIFLGLLAATGVSIGDSTLYFVGYQGRTILPEKANRWFGWLYEIGMSRPKLFILLCFLYSCIVPASNDFITIPAGLARYPFWKVMIPLALGNIVFDISLASLAAYAYEALRGIIF